MRAINGFTLIELMIVLMILSILSMIALPMYSKYGREAQQSRAEQQMQNFAMQLHQHKARQFNYLGFVPGGATAVTLPEGATGTSIKYSITIKDTIAGNPILTDDKALGHEWVMKAEATDVNLYSYLYTSSGLKCKNKTKANISYIGCGVGGEAW